MSFSDIFKSSFLQQYSTDISTGSILFYLCVGAVMGFYIFLIYRALTKKSFYNKSFNIALWTLTVVTTAIIITISSNLVLSLGMVGALSIVRYRTAIKDPMDLVFLFWALAEGIMCGAGMAVIGVMLAVVMTVGIFVLDKLPVAKALKIMTISASDMDEEDAIMEVIKKYCKIYTVRSKSISGGQLNLVLEFGTDAERECIKELTKISGVYAVSSLTHDGEVTF